MNTTTFFIIIWILFLMLISIASFIVNYVLKIPVNFPEKYLIPEEKILVPSSLHAVRSARGLLFSYQKLLLTITNKRIIIAFSLFGFWIYSFGTRNLWFKKDSTVKGEFIDAVSINEKGDRLRVNIHDHTFSIEVEDAARLISQLILP